MNLTIITPTLGRASLAKVADCIRRQAYPAHWLIIFDGADALKEGIKYVPSDIPSTVVCSNKPARDQYTTVFSALEHVKTPYVCFMDDDNEFSPNHTKLLINAFQKGHRFVATLRLYTDENYQVNAKEHPKSEHIDTNNMALETNLLRDAAAFYERENTDKTYFTDRHLTAYLIARGVFPYRVNAYTMKYKIDPRRGSWPGKVIFESLSGTVIPMGLTAGDIIDESLLT